MAKKTIFTRDAAERVVRATRQIERQQTEPSRRQRHWPAAEPAYRIIPAKAIDSITAPGTGTVAILDGDSLESLAATGNQVEATSLFDDIAVDDWLLIAETVRGYLVVRPACN